MGFHARVHADFDSGLRRMAAFRERAGLQRGCVACAPVLWAAFTVFLHAGSGLAGFCLHAALCPPRRLQAKLALAAAYAALCIGWAWEYRDLSRTGLPFHRETHASERFRFYQGTVDNFPVPGKHGALFPLQTEAGLYLASLPAGSPLPRWGAAITALGREKAPEPPDNPGQRDSRLLLRSRGACAFLTVESWREIHSPPVWKNLLATLRLKLGASLRAHIPTAALPLVAGALLNDVEGIAPETKQDFLRSGMQHVLAISGQHIGLLVAVLLFLGLGLRLPRKAAFVCAACLTLCYIPVVGAPASVVRAGIMLACMLPALLLERPSSGLNAICLSLAMDLLAHPFGILDLGLQLSYAATLALILGAKPGREIAERCAPLHPWLGAGAQMVFLSVLVTLFTFPILAASTHALSPWSVLGNLVTVPLSSAMLVGGLCVWLFSPVACLADWAGACTGLCSLVLEGAVHFLAHLPGALRSISAPSPGSLWGFAIAIAAVTLAFNARAWRLGLLFTAAIIAMECNRAAWTGLGEGKPRVTFLSIGHGDAAVLEMPGAVFLIDAGPGEREARQMILPYLRSRGIQRIDALLLTHPDLDHFGGAFGLFGNISIGEIVAPRVSAGPQASWRCLETEAGRLRIPWRQAGAGDALYRGRGGTLRVLGPDSSLASASDNDRSLVCLLETPGGKVLLTGDIEGPGQRALAASWPLWRGAWLKAPHHGSDRTTLPCFLAAVAPPRAAISSGRRPGFPGPNTLEVLQSLGTQTGVTARTGAMTWELGDGLCGGRKNRRM